MKIRLFSAIALSVVLLASCSQGNDQAEKIKALEEKIAAMEGANTPVAADLANSNFLKWSTTLAQSMKVK
jgi:uncharacterized lipoprotein